ncbi:hypothetical protein HJG60_010581 [Phyllostomus discolor]|nr:hypothetical protein HJG60_010581 [Phyllostomus discolor]
MLQGTSAASCRLFINIHKWKQRPSVRERFMLVAAQGHGLERCWVRGSGGSSLPSPGLSGPRVVCFLDAMSVQPLQEKERNINVKEKHQLVTFSCAPWAGTEPATLWSTGDTPVN